MYSVFLISGFALCSSRAVISFVCHFLKLSSNLWRYVNMIQEVVAANRFNFDGYNCGNFDNVFFLYIAIIVASSCIAHSPRVRA